MAPPPNAIRHVEQSAQAVASLDVDAATAHDIVQAVDDYTIGYVMRELSDAYDDEHNDEWHTTMDAAFTEVLGDSPHAKRFLDQAFASRGEDRFETGLKWLLDGIEKSL
jgi:hypothetical protein